MKTLERPRDSVQTPTPPSTQAHRSSRRRLFSALVAVLALVVGGVTGWIIRGDGTEDAPSIVVADGGELTERQLEMVDFLDDYVEAWRAGDGAAMVEMYNPLGTLNVSGTVYPVQTGSLAELVEATPTPTLDLLEPLVVLDNELVSLHRLGGFTYKNAMTFTPSGELLLTNHTITN